LEICYNSCISCYGIFIRSRWKKTGKLSGLFSGRPFRRDRVRAVITVIGKDMVGILAKVSTTCAEANANVIEVTQSVLQEFFAMIMLIDMSEMNCELAKLRSNLKDNVEGMTIHVMHEDIFNSMHRI
jgi:ACT domain-containing protein